MTPLEKSKTKSEGLCPHGNFYPCTLCDGLESESKIHREIEVKIINIGSPEELIQKITQVQGELVEDKKLLRDTDFKPTKEKERGRKISI